VNYLRDATAAESVVGAIRAAGGRAASSRGDVAIEADVLAMFDAAQRELGPVTGLVNNAGILERQTRLGAAQTVVGIEIPSANAVDGNPNQKSSLTQREEAPAKPLNN